MQTVQTAIDDFLVSDEVSRLGPAAQKRNGVVLRVLLRVAGPTTPAANISRSVIDAVLTDRRANGVGEATLNAYRSTLRLFGGWLVSVGYAKIKINPAAHLRNTKTVVARSKRRPVTADQLREMFKISGERHPRDRAALMLLAYTGARSSEIVDLRWRDTDMDERTLTVFRSKVKDYHTLSMPAELYEELVTWRAWYEENHGPVKPAWRVVPALRPRGWGLGKTPFRMSPDWKLAPTNRHTTLLERVKWALRTVVGGDLTGLGCHTIRRTAANLILNSTNDIRAAQHLLGHSSVSMTEKYLDINAQAARYNGVIKDWSI